MSSPTAGGTPGPTFSIEDGLEILDRRKWWILIALALGLAAGGGLYLAIPPSYTASTMILVEPQEVPTDFIRPTVTTSVRRRLDTLRERVTSYANLTELIDRVGQDRLDPTGQKSREEVMNKIRGNLDVTIGSNFARAATVFTISYSGRDPEVLAHVAREIASLFVTENLKDRERQATATEEFLDRELSRLREEVIAHETSLRDFRELYMGRLPDQLNANLRTLDRLNAQLATNLDAQEGLAQRMALIRRQLSDAGAGDPTLGAPSALSVALQNARERLIGAESVYTPEHPNVIQLREEIERLEKMAKEAVEQLEAGETPALDEDPMFRSVRVELETAQLELDERKREEQEIRDEIAQYSKRVDETPRLEQELRSLTRDYDNLTSTYRTILARKHEAALARSLERAQKGERFKVLRPARVPLTPSFPDLMLFLPGGLAAGLGIVAGLILLAEFRNPAFRSVARLTRTLGLPVIASIPRIDNERIYEEKPDGEVEPRLVVYTASESAPAEQYRSFTPTFLEDQSRRVVLVTSAARGDGKSLTCMNLALTVACDLNRRVLVIDGDLRRPTAHSLLRVSRRTGLSDVLAGRADLAAASVATGIPNLTLLPAGPSVRNPLALLTDKSFIDLIERARQEFDAVFIDSPPLLPVVDTRFLRRMADLVVFVVRADTTPRAAVVRSLQELREVAGAVFNEVSPGSFRRYYYYDAYSRYAYGDPNDGAESSEEPIGRD